MRRLAERPVWVLVDKLAPSPAQGSSVTAPDKQYVYVRATWHRLVCYILR